MLGRCGEEPAAGMRGDICLGGWVRVREHLEEGGSTRSWRGHAQAATESQGESAGVSGAAGRFQWRDARRRERGGLVLNGGASSGGAVQPSAGRTLLAARAGNASGTGG